MNGLIGEELYGGCDISSYLNSAAGEGDPTRGLGVDRCDDGSEKPGGSAIAPPISKECEEPESSMRLFRLHLLQ